MKTSRIGTGGTRAILVHGNDLCGEFYAPLARELAERDFSTTLITLPALPTWSGLVDAVLAAGESHHVLIGHSMGGLIALLAAARRPAWLRNLVLLEPAILPNRMLASIAARRYMSRVINAQRERFENWNGGMRRIHDMSTFPRSMIDLYLGVRASADVDVARALFASQPALYPLPYAQVNVPTLLITGASTGFVGRLMARSVKRDHHVVIPNAAHWLANEQDALVADAIKTRLSV